MNEKEWQSAGEIASRGGRPALLNMMTQCVISCQAAPHHWKWQAFADTYQAGEPVGGARPTPSGLIAPTRGFGKIWWNNPELQEGLGWAIAPEQADIASAVIYSDMSWND